MADILKDDIIKDEANMKWHLRILNRSKKVKRSVFRALSRTQSSMRDAFHATSFRMSRIGSERYNRSLSRSVTMGVRAAASISEQSRAIVQHPSFDWGVLLAVTVNAVVLCLYRYGMSKDLFYTVCIHIAVWFLLFTLLALNLTTLDGIQAVLLVTFAAELLLRFLAYGPPTFYEDKMNMVDLVVVAVSAGALVSRAYPNISAFRIMRWFYLSKKYVDKHPSVVYYTFADGYPRAHHDSMLQTMLLWFSVTTAEGWPNQMWNSMRPGTEHMRLIRRMQSRVFTRSGSWVVGAVEGMKTGLGNLAYRVLSMNVRPVKTQSKKQKHRSRRKDRDSGKGQDNLEAVSTAAAEQTSASSTEPQRRRSRNSQILQASGFPPNIGEKRGSRTALEDAVLTLADITKPPSFKSPSLLLSRDMSRKGSGKRQSFQLSDYEQLEKNIDSIERPWYLHEGSLLLFGEKSHLRKHCKAIVESKWWEWFSIAWVGIGTWIVIEMRATGEPVFMLELLLKVIANGFMFSPDAVLNDPYNILDIFIVIIDAVNLATWGEKSRRAVHALTALRPFRFISRISGLRSLMSNLVKTLPAIIAVLLFTFMLFVTFGSIGIQLFRGRLYFCNDSKISHRAYCTGHYYNNVGVYSPRAWVNPNFHFDDIGNAFLSLFVCSTFDNWVTNWLYPVMDIVGENKQPQRDNSPAYALYFVAFCVCGGFFIIRVFIGVFINEFGKNSGSLLLTERQKLWRDMNRIIQKLKPGALPRPPKNYIRKLCFYAIRNRHYQNTMIVCLLGYSGLLATNYAGQPAYVSNRRQKAHCALTAYFLVESLTKFLGDEFRVYRYEYSRHIEAVISILAGAGLMGLKGTPRGYVGRFAYIARVFCIIPHVPRARVIMRVMFICCPTIGEIMALLGIFLFLFAGIGFQMFSQVADGACIGPLVTTLDNWSCIMADAMLGTPKCTDGNTMLKNDCGYPFAGVIYFVCLIVVASHIFMNLFVAVILDAITFGLVNENSMVTPEHLLAFKSLWAELPFDPEYLRIEFEVMSFRVPDKGIPFKQLLETLTLYKIGPTGLPLTLRIEREKRIQDVYIRGATTKVQALVRGFLVRRRAARARGEEFEGGFPLLRDDQSGGNEEPQQDEQQEQQLRSKSMLVEEEGS
ncbi:voltage-dependent L-type calcium channel subunit alpha-1S-like [Selaginella moellendorffii]|uniref:voltage-dependent L-type calcium channel subunit alpha-1S-like n=1 Tax=Selaginella moellendorffii TaxID=88036 RepID=UPI000D1C38C9|nr:voltage-dependent L-type calcium channel subunit alpha-1S-like [Selaginella moellendorffii]|eukprot:XP_024524545.1 voltage-dependent L-type calcium channel subunit alpha-1S-like [Selaginella moellendorffii]